MISNATTRLFMHRKFKDEVALNYEFDKSLDARLVAVYEFFIGILCFAILRFETKPHAMLREK